MKRLIELDTEQNILNDFYEKHAKNGGDDVRIYKTEFENGKIKSIYIFQKLISYDLKLNAR